MTSRIPAAVIAPCIRRKGSVAIAVKGLAPETAVESDAAVVKARMEAIVAARYIAVDARPFDLRLPRGKAAPLYFVAYEFWTGRAGGRCVRILAAYNVRLDILRYHPLDMVIHADKGTAEIRNIAAMPGISSGTTLVQIATALCRYMGVGRIELYDASTRYCRPPGGPWHGYTHWLTYLRGEGFYHAFGFRPRAEVAWRRTVERLHRLKTADVLAALQQGPGRISSHPFVQWLQWSAHPPVFADAIATMTCDGFAAYEEFVRNYLDETDNYPKLLEPIMETYRRSWGLQRWDRSAATKGGGGKARGRTVLYKQAKYKLMRLDDRRMLIAFGDHSVLVTIAPKASKVDTETLTPALLDFLCYMARTSWKTRRLEFIVSTQYIFHPKLPMSGLLYRRDVAEYATPAETEAAVADALRYIAAVDWEAYLDRAAAWQDLPGAYTAYVRFMAQGDIEDLDVVADVSHSRMVRRIEQVRGLLRKAVTTQGMGWNQAAAAFCDLVFYHGLPHVWIAAGVRYMDRALWKAVSTVAGHVEGWYVDVAAGANGHVDGQSYGQGQGEGV